MRAVACSKCVPRVRSHSILRGGLRQETLGTGSCLGAALGVQATGRFGEGCPVAGRAEKQEVRKEDVLPRTFMKVLSASWSGFLGREPRVSRQRVSA